MVWVEDKYPNLLFAKDGEVYDFDGYKCLVIGGAYSVDKYWRIFRRGEGELLLNEHYADIAVFARGNTSDLKSELKKRLNNPLILYLAILARFISNR